MFTKSRIPPSIISAVPGAALTPHSAEQLTDFSCGVEWATELNCKIATYLLNGRSNRNWETLACSQLYSSLIAISIEIKREPN